MKKILIILSIILLAALRGIAQTPEVKQKDTSLILRYQTYPAYTRIVLEGDEEILKEAKVLRNGDSQFSIEFKKKPSEIKPSTLSIYDGVVRSVELIEKGDKKTLSIILEIIPKDYKSFLLKNPARRVIDIYKEALTFSSTQTSTTSTSAKVTVVIDPGHGGPGSGIVSSSGLQEKVLTLDLALRIKTFLQKNHDIRVILTRTSDVAVPLRDRAYMGNSNKADLFISLHGNNSFGKSKKEFAIYILPVDIKTYEERTPYLWDILHEKAIKESSRLAETLKEGIKKNRGGDINIREAPILELLGVEAPSVLLEVPMGPEEEKNLQKESYKNKIASDICEGIITYIRKKMESVRLEG